jgi:hypothetical protein
MHSAVAYGFLDAIDLLLIFGPSAIVLDEFGHTPYDSAVNSGQTGGHTLLRPEVPHSLSLLDLFTGGSSAYGLICTEASLLRLRSSGD